MNLEDLLTDKPVTKVSWPDPNIANTIRDHLRNLVPGLFTHELPGVWLTGSNVWRFLYGIQPDPTSDIDVMCANYFARIAVIDALGLERITETTPSMNERPARNGVKYRMPNGRTVDIWSMSATPWESLREYPVHSHAQCMAAYSPELHVLIVLPNPKAQ